MNAAVEILRAGDDRGVALRLRGDDRRVDVRRAELRHQVRQAARAFAALGVTPGERVVLVLPDGPELVFAFLGAIWHGSVPIVLSSFLRADVYAAIVAESAARAVVATELVLAGLRAEGACPVPAAAMLSVAPDGGGTLGAAIARQDATAGAHDAAPDAPAFWLYSSGTTGRPKGVIHTQRAVDHAVASYGRHVLAVRPDDVAYATSKLFFAYGLGGGLYFPLAAGGTTVLSPEPFTPERTWRILAEETPSLFFAVPSAYRALLDAAPANAAAALARARRCVSAGEALPEPIARAWRDRFGLDILDGLGATEALHIFLSQRPEALVPGTVGRPVPGYDVRVVDEHGAPCPAGTPGALRVRGASIAAGYWQRPDAAARAFVDGWLVTGDQAIADADGAIRLLGRTDDLLKVSGQWVSPIEIEEVIAAVPGVRECAVVGAPDASGLTELVAWIAAPSDDGTLPARVAGACEILSRFKRPKRVQVIEALPRTPTGKIQRFVLRERCGGAEPKGRQP